MENKVCALSGEQYSRFTAKGGVRVCVIRKPGYSNMYAMFGTNYGSMDTVCNPIGGGQPMPIPDGTAHFLEHKLFESEIEDAFVRFSRTGADANAFTTFDKTVYLFSCTERFEESFGILLDFVTHPYFTEQTVLKEQGIIGQEIKMYDDDPEWRVILNLLQAMFRVNPVRIDTAGTVETIATITPEVLYNCYNTFYNPENMEIIVCGDVDPERVRAICDAQLEARPSGRVTRPMCDEPDDVNEARVTQKLSVSMPQFLVGYKDVPACTGSEASKRAAITNILLDMLFGPSSDFYGRLYGSGMINNKFSAAYDYGCGFGSSLIGGESSEPDRVADEISKTVAVAVEQGIDEKDFIRAKKKQYGRLMRKLNSVEDTAVTFIEFDFLGVDFAEYMQIFDAITLENCTARLREHFTAAHRSLSIIEPAD